MMVIMVMTTVAIVVEAYRSGPGVYRHPEVCDTMSPISGHYNAEPMSSPPPFQIRSLTTKNCYKAGEPVECEQTALSCCKQEHAVYAVFQCKSFIAAYRIVSYACRIF